MQTPILLLSKGVPVKITRSLIFGNKCDTLSRHRYGNRNVLTLDQAVRDQPILRVFPGEVQAEFLPPTSQPPLRAYLLAYQAMCGTNRELHDIFA